MSRKPFPLPDRFRFLNKCCRLDPGPAGELAELSRRWRTLLKRYPDVEREQRRIAGVHFVSREVVGEFEQLLEDLRAFGKANGCIPIPRSERDAAFLRSATLEQLLSFCREKRDELAPCNQHRSSDAFRSPSLLREVWAAMGRLRAVVPPRPALLRVNENDSFVPHLLGEHEKCPHPEDALAALDLAINWCAEQLARRDQGRTGQDGGAKPKGKRGRKPDTDPKADQRVAEAWGSGEYKDHAECAAALGMTKPNVKAALDRHRKRHPKRNRPQAPE